MGYPQGCTELDKTEATQHVHGAGAFFFFWQGGGELIFGDIKARVVCL